MSFKKKLSMVALAASLLGCKSAMAVSPFVSPSISAGYEYFNGKKKSGRDDSKERSKVNISLPIPTLDDLKFWVPASYIVANEIAGDFYLADREFFGKFTVGKGGKKVAEKVAEFVDYLKNKYKTAEYIKSQKLYDENSNAKREKYYYENLEKVLLNFGVGTEMSKKLVDIMNIQENSDGSLSYNFLSEFLKNGKVPAGNNIAQKIDISGFRGFVNQLRGKSKLDIERKVRFIFDEKQHYVVKYIEGFNGEHVFGYQKLEVADFSSRSLRKNGYLFYDCAEFFWKTNFTH